MKYDRVGVLALLVLVALAVGVQRASAQRITRSVYQDRGPNPAMEMNARSSTNAFVEELPPGAMLPGQMPPNAYSDGFAGDGFSVDGYHPEGYCDDPCCTDGGCHESSSCGNSGLCGPACTQGQFFFTADYLYVRANFSEAVAFVEQDLSQQNLVTREVVNLDFEYESSYRLGGGYRMGCCGDELRFLYTRFASSAEDEVDFSTDVFIPYEPGTPPGGRTLIDGDVNVNSFDLECAKTIPLCQQCCDCGDACSGQCGECCTQKCPTWDITWSGGIRAAEADWERSYTALDANDAFVGDAVVTMDFEGVGAKFSLEGRRYFGKTGWLSAFLKGDISLLAGELELESVRTIEGGSTPDNVIIQTFENRQIIPVTEIEAGATGQVTCNTRVSAGYLFSAWHDLGFRDEFELAGASVFPVTYDDANILGFDGFFARVEVAY